nr:MAG TPA: hypothetical protein [Caudoviricetes sp.]
MFASLCPKAFAISVATAHHSPSFSTNLISWLHQFSIFIKSPPYFYLSIYIDIKFSYYTLVGVPAPK